MDKLEVSLMGFINSLAPNEQVTTGSSKTTSSTYENKAITDMLVLLDQLLKRLMSMTVTECGM